MNYLASLTKAEYEKLCMFDYGDLYSIKTGAKHTFFGKQLQIFPCVNRYGKLYIQVNFYPEGHKSFDFDCLDDAVQWAKKRVTVTDQKMDGGAEA